MPIHTLASVFGDISTSQLIAGAATFAVVFWVKLWSGGKKCSWEKEWAGKMILVVAPPTPTIITLIDQLLQLPSPPQILFLPPIPSPLPQDILTILHAIRLSASRNPLAQLHCESLPRTPEAVRDFTKKWATAPTGTTGADGRRIDAVVLGEGWEVRPMEPKVEGKWSVHEHQYHLLTALLPYLLRAPKERSIRIVSLVSPAWTSAIPSMTGVKPRDDIVYNTGRRSISTILLMKHFQLILDTLAAAALGAVKPVPGADDEAEMVKKRDMSVKSNVMSISVIMPWARTEVLKAAMVETPLSKILWILLYPFVLILTPSSQKTIQSILFALSAPVRYEPLDDTLKVKNQDKEALDPRRSTVGGGDVVRDCAVVDVPPVLCDPALAKATYDDLEKRVEAGVKRMESKDRTKSEGK
ncbi:hypothetical protein C347_00562 [Cryptococcus neoformans AD2-60a]|nr:hypothetical protein C347_00562 [Cryptococcus neoformans var. grubii AD2-60a]OXC87154.1 hypothetical protein C344_00492 [Cryptococcus neoformans var. grubii AD1-7a]OXG40754.1 hypothetical protein C360_00535 [Cryptococcus neoformans var. grubii Bt15]OXG45418.1 hypothetical protein C359_00102 [Cryptococcus neoformans var. grubii Bt120]OXH39761.1 hypothetical protein J005_00490 [Cryptococcus neoformans var. grubii]